MRTANKPCHSEQEQHSLVQMKMIMTDDHQTGSYLLNEVGLLCYFSKWHVVKEGCDTLTYGNKRA